MLVKRLPWTALAMVAAAALAWELCVRLLHVPAWLLPPPSRIFQSLGQSWGLISHHTLVTLEEAAVGFMVALAAGIALALLIVSFRTAERTLYPLVVASQTIPIIALAPLLIVWFGYGLTPKVIVVALISFFPIAVTTVDGIRGVDRDYVNLMRSMGASRAQVLAKVLWPGALPSVLSGARVAAPVSVIGAVIGEWVGSSAGLGYFITRSSAQLLTPRVFAAILMLSLMGIAFFYAVSLFERWATPWRFSPSANERK